MTSIDEQIQHLIQIVGTNVTTPSAYDTAWVARLHEIDAPLADKALEWICEHQLPDGSWGASQPHYFHDRAICTLAALGVLYQRGRRAKDQLQRERGVAALERAFQGLAADPAGATPGFELLVPTLMKEARNLGMPSVGGERLLSRLERHRAAKLAILPGNVINRYITPAFSLEMTGVDEQRLLDIPNLRDPNGAVACNPSATAYFLANIQADQQGLDYLRTQVKDGAVTANTPFENFETSWVLWNLAQANVFDANRAVAQPHLDLLTQHWRPGKGSAFTVWCGLIDGDTTSMMFDALALWGQAPDVETLLKFETPTHFRCYQLETNPSLSTNVHMLGALQRAGLPPEHPALQKIIAFLRQNRTLTYWYDKWHVSPYYTTAHVILNARQTPAMADLVEDAVEWILATQHPNGAWGYYLPTAEETAYCLQALLSLDLPKTEKIIKAIDWLEAHIEPPYPQMWFAKALFSPELIVRSAILAALKLAGR